LLFSITIIPDHFFGETFTPQPSHIANSNVPSNVKILEPTNDEVKRLYFDKVVAQPESLKMHNKFIYTGNFNGQILKVDPQTKKVSVLTTMVDKEAKICENNVVSKEMCGRGLDLDIVGNTLYATDVYRGFIEYDLVKNTKINYDLRTIIPGYESNDKVFNSIRQDPTNSNIVYISLSSTKYGYDKISFIFLEQEASGIVIAFNKATKKLTVIAKELALANGLEVVGQSLLVNDLIRKRIMKLNLKEVQTFIQSGGKDLPKLTVFKDGLPGYPDNLTKSGKYLFAALFFYIPENDVLLDQLALNIHARKFAHRIMYLATIVVKFVKQYYTCDCMNKLLYSLESGNGMMALPYKSAVAILDQTTGEYVSLIKLPLNKITHAMFDPSTSTLYLGSILHNAIHTMSLKL